MGLNKFKASNGWLEKFKQRHELKFRTLSGESASADHAIILNFLSELNIKVEQYEKENIFNCDETSLFIKLTPRKSFVKTGDSARGFKMSKDKVTLHLCCSYTGEKFEPLIIGKYRNPRCFKNFLPKFMEFYTLRPKMRG
ncbi:tigger transposable element-derived protein 4-like [Octopus sinensis]|uniref:Tigger transposable element-derived protein 4-like n=1 Tax=Octopus sinensis TaxID=2607531 RepID=A0A6P7TS67_9MOLL|nr:tigger transposable element-derived protein 4-like [Octopus sinensis]